MKNVKKFFLLSCAIYCTACSGNGNTGNSDASVTPGGENTSLYTGRYRSLEDWRVPTCLALSIAM